MRQHFQRLMLQDADGDIDHQETNHADNRKQRRQTSSNHDDLHELSAF